MDMKKTVRVLLSVGITVIIFAILFTQIKVTDLIETIAQVPFHFILLGGLFYSLGYVFRMLRFSILTDHVVPKKRMLGIVCVHNFFTQLLPFKTGELSFLHYLKKEGHSYARGGAVILVARILDVAMMLLLFSISIMFVKDDLPETVLPFLPLFILLIVVIIMSFFAYSALSRPILKIARKIDIGMLTRLLEQLYAVRTDKKMVELLLVSLGMWLSFNLAIYYILLGVFDLSFWHVIVGHIFPVLISVLPIQGIGGFGTIEGGWALGLMLIGLDKGAAISAGFTIHFMHIIYFIIWMAYGIPATRRKKEKVQS